MNLLLCTQLNAEELVEQNTTQNLEQIHDGYTYQQTKNFEPVFTIYQNTVDVFKEAFKKEHLGTWGIIAASTSLLYIFDQKISNETKRFGRRIHLGNKDNTKEYVKLFGFSLFRGPGDFGSTLYFLGDGWVSLFTSGTFYLTGKITNDYRAIKTSSELLNGLLVTGIITQALKRTTGRESPVSATVPRGRWQPFPTLKKFQGHISAYDAFPSGHLATLIMSTTIIAENYQDYRYIRPIGYTLATLLGFQMINNDVHWISDYPLGIAIGYLIGKTVAKNGRTKVEETTSTTYDIVPILSNNGHLGMGLSVNY